MAGRKADVVGTAGTKQQLAVGKEGGGNLSQERGLDV